MGQHRLTAIFEDTLHKISTNFVAQDITDNEEYKAYAAMIEAVLEAKPDSPLANTLKGKALCADREFQAALPYLEKAYMKGVRDTDTLYDYAICLYKDKAYDCALFLIDQVVEVHPNDHDLVFMQAFCQYKMGDYNTSAENLRRIVDDFTDLTYSHEPEIVEILKALLDERLRFAAAPALKPETNTDTPGAPENS